VSTLEGFSTVVQPQQPLQMELTAEEVCLSYCACILHPSFNSCFLWPAS